MRSVPLPDWTGDKLSELVQDQRHIHPVNLLCVGAAKVLSSLAGSEVDRTFLWGPDLSGSMTGAGDVGGLLSATYQGVTYEVCSDANGNVTGLVPVSGTGAGMLVARFDDDPFRNRVTNAGPSVELCPLGFSSKHLDTETGVVSYELRGYLPGLGRWMSRDPIGEEGGINNYVGAENDFVSKYDLWGLLSLGDKISVYCGTSFAFFKKKAGKIGVLKFKVECGNITELNGLTRGTASLAFGVDFNLQFTPSTKDCCCKNGRYRWCQTITKDTDPLYTDAVVPRPDKGDGSRNLALSYNMSFHDMPTIPNTHVNLAWNLNGRQGAMVDINFRLELQCEQGASIKKLKTINWGLWVKYDNLTGVNRGNFAN